MELFLFLAWSHTWKNFSQFCNKSVQQRRFAKPSFVSCWQLETGYKMWFPNMEYQNHGLFFAGDHALAATKNCYVDLIYIFSFLWEERADNLCAIDSTCLLFDFIYKFALNHSPFINYAVRVPINVISLHSNKETLSLYCKLGVIFYTLLHAFKRSFPAKITECFLDFNRV